MRVIVGVSVCVAVSDGANVSVGVDEGVIVKVAVFIGVLDGVSVKVDVGVAVCVGVGVSVVRKLIRTGKLKNNAISATVKQELTTADNKIHK